jgi:LPPG:FO 2-phospho-L-lactate transferase
MYRELGIEPSALAVAKHYSACLRGMVIDQIDVELSAPIRGLKMQVCVTNTLMKSLDDRMQLAREVLRFIGEAI